jgi:uncharacterized iron-regulated membrane protein
LARSSFSISAAARRNLKRQGLTGGYALLLPTGPTGGYTASVYPNQPQGQRTLFFDRYSGALIRETGYRDYG